MYFEATLCTGRSIKVKELTTLDEELAIKALGQANLQETASQKALVNELIKMMLVEVDGKPVTYDQVNVLSDVFRTKEMRQLEALYNEIHVPSQKDEESFLASIKPVSTTK